MRLAVVRAAQVALCVFFIQGCVQAESIERRQAGENQEPPNVIYIMADDLGYGDLGCYGQEKIRTPHIDRLAAEGMRFTQHYSGSTVCAPSRCVLMTGLHTGHAFIRDNADFGGGCQRPIPEETVTIAKVFQQTGYRTGCIGKWGLGGPESVGHPNNQGFDHFFGYLCQVQAHNYYPEYLWRNEQKLYLKGKVYSHDLMTEEALTFIKQAGEQPFFLYLPYTIPHTKFQVPELGEYEAMEGWSRKQKVQAAMISRMDRDIGRIMALLKSSGLDEKTLVFFTSDNGPHGFAGTREFFDANGPLRGIKRDLYEGGVRVPLIAHWPGRIAAGTSSDHISAHWDFFATCVELLGVESPEVLWSDGSKHQKTDGISYLPTLLGQDERQGEHAFLYWEFKARRRQAIRMGQWKLVRDKVGSSEQKTELFDLSTDVGEKRDIAAKYPEMVALLDEKMGQARIESAEFPLLSAEEKTTDAKNALSSGIDQRPNIVFIMADDLGWCDLSTGLTNLGHPSSFYETPAIDTLAAEGMAFTNAYTNGTNCAPTRAALLTGQWAQRPTNNVYLVNHLNRGKPDAMLVGPKQGIPNGEDEIPGEAVTLAETLKKAGYITAHFGKYHVGGSMMGINDPLSQGFDYNYGGGSPGHPNAYHATKEKVFRENIGPELNAFAGDFTQEYVDRHIKPYAKDTPEEAIDALVGTRKHLTCAMGDAALEFLGMNKTGPFYMQFHPYAVHTPIGDAHARKDLLAKYKAKAPVDDDGDGPETPSYGAIMEGMDQSIARIKRYLEQADDPRRPGRKLAENTLVIFMSDNGGRQRPSYLGPLRGQKGDIEEGGIRVPTIAWSGGSDLVKGGTICHTPVSGIDFYQTFCELAKADTSALQLDGDSLVALFKNESTKLSRNLYWHVPGYLASGRQLSPCSVVRSGKYKLIYKYEGFQDDPFELYDLSADLGEKTDLSQSRPEVVETLGRDLMNWLKETQAPLVILRKGSLQVKIDGWAYADGKTREYGGETITIREGEEVPFVVQRHARVGQKPDRPNIVWLVSEDNSANWLRLYNENGATMPHIERLAQQGIVFNNAFSCAPVCSVARSTIISGCYAPRVGAQYHRRARAVPMPPGVKMFPWYLRQAGYYTTNNSKQDYNFLPGERKEVWDASSNKASYRNRKQGQPFFHVQNYVHTHEGNMHQGRNRNYSAPTRNQPADVVLYDYHPDTAVFRHAYARYLDRHEELDEQLGRFIEQLREDELLSETIVFYYSDHGGALPRGKGYAYDNGLHVPLVVYVPEKFRHLAPAAPDSRVDGFVEFVDLSATVLNLAGVKLPSGIDGKPFLGEGVTLASLNQRKITFGYADRFDEKYDLVRTIRKGRYRYIRNYQPFNIDGLYNEYRYFSPAYQQWRKLYREGKLSAEQRQFFEPRPAEMLFDLQSDPHEVKNLAGDPAYASQLKELRGLLTERVKSMPDLSFVPEPIFLSEGGDNPVGYGQVNRAEIANLVDIADLSLRPFAEVQTQIDKALASHNPWQRYWGLIVCSCFGNEAVALSNKVKQLAEDDPQPLVRVRAAEFLGLTQQADPRLKILSVLERTEDQVEALLILNTAALLHDIQSEYPFDLSHVAKNRWGKTAQRRLVYLSNPPN